MKLFAVVAVFRFSPVCSGIFESFSFEFPSLSVWQWILVFFLCVPLPILSAILSYRSYLSFPYSESSFPHYCNIQLDLEHAVKIISKDTKIRISPIIQDYTGYAISLSECDKAKERFDYRARESSGLILFSLLLSLYPFSSLLFSILKSLLIVAVACGISIILFVLSLIFCSKHGSLFAEQYNVPDTEFYPRGDQLSYDATPEEADRYFAKMSERQIGLKLRADYFQKRVKQAISARWISFIIILVLYFAYMLSGLL